MEDTGLHQHYCHLANDFPSDKFLQRGSGLGRRVLIVGEAPASNGWRVSGKAFYTPEGRLLPTGRNLNELLKRIGLSAELCGFTELVKCFVGRDRNVLDKCGEKCWPIFLRQVQEDRYDVLIILGVKTLQIFNRMHGTKLQIGEIGTIVIGNRYCHCLAIYHPSPISPCSRRRNAAIFDRVQDQLCSILIA